MLSTQSPSSPPLSSTFSSPEIDMAEAPFEVRSDPQPPPQPHADAHTPSAPARRPDNEDSLEGDSAVQQHVFEQREPTEAGAPGAVRSSIHDEPISLTEAEVDMTVSRTSWDDHLVESLSGTVKDTEPNPEDMPSVGAALHAAFGSTLSVTQDAPSSHGGEDADPEPAVVDHPLMLNTHPPSPPPWERIDPPPRTRAVHEFPGKPTRSRPVVPYSSYYFGPPPPDAAYGTPPMGQIGVHHPREVVRIERDYSGGELIQFAPTYPLELEGRLTPTQFLETINSINERLLEAHSLRHSVFDNAFAFFSLQLSRLVWSSHYEKEMLRLQQLIEELNSHQYNPVGLHIRWPRKVGFLFLEIEYY